MTNGEVNYSPMSAVCRKTRLLINVKVRRMLRRRISVPVIADSLAFRYYFKMDQPLLPVPVFLHISILQVSIPGCLNLQKLRLQRHDDRHYSATRQLLSVTTETADCGWRYLMAQELPVISPTYEVGGTWSTAEVSSSQLSTRVTRRWQKLKQEVQASGFCNLTYHHLLLHTCTWSFGRSVAKEEMRSTVKPLITLNRVLQYSSHWEVFEREKKLDNKKRSLFEFWVQV